jgi:hypothetical protein
MSLFELKEDLKGVKQEKKIKSRENIMLHNQIKNLEVIYIIAYHLLERTFKEGPGD